MAKGQLRSNREKKKPKATVAKTTAAAPQGNDPKGYKFNPAARPGAKKS